MREIKEELTDMESEAGVPQTSGPFSTDALREAVGTGNIDAIEKALGNLFWHHLIDTKELEAINAVFNAATIPQEIRDNRPVFLYSNAMENLSSSDRTPERLALGIDCLKKLSSQGYVPAQFTLGMCYMTGKGIVKDEKEAVKWYRQAAEQGQAWAQFTLGLWYERGIGVVKDEKEAVKWYRQAAEQGQAWAQFTLGMSYVTGIGVVKDEKEAVAWYRQAADQGHAKAQTSLGVRYEQGIGVEKDEREAVKLYRRAAEQGDAKAQTNLGVCYEQGRGGLLKSREEAVKWLQKAADQKCQPAIDALSRLSNPPMPVAAAPKYPSVPKSAAAQPSSALPWRATAPAAVPKFSLPVSKPAAAQPRVVASFSANNPPASASDIAALRSEIEALKRTVASQQIEINALKRPRPSLEETIADIRERREQGEPGKEARPAPRGNGTGRSPGGK